MDHDSSPITPVEDLPTREGYDRWAVIYDDEDNPLVKLEQRFFSDLLGPVHRLDVLDAGCGTGRQTLALVRGGARVTAMDFSEGMLSRARRTAALEGVRFVQHDLNTTWPLADRSFDRVVSCLAIEHVPELDALFRELARVCRPDGAIVLSAMHPAMMLRGVSARFTDPDTGARVRPRSYSNGISDMVMAASRASLHFQSMSEHCADERLIAESPRAARYLGWPMLLLMRLVPRIG